MSVYIKRIDSDSRNCKQVTLILDTKNTKNIISPISINFQVFEYALCFYNSVFITLIQTLF